jgi:hypothetical protein
MWYFPLLTLSDIKNIDLRNTHLILKFIEVYTIPKIKEGGFIKQLISKNNCKINSLLKPYLEKSDIVLCVNYNNKELCEYLISIYGKSELKSLDLQKHLYKKEIFKLFYEPDELTDDIADYWTDQYKMPEYLYDYIYRDPNRLFKKLKKRKNGRTY